MEYVRDFMYKNKEIGEDYYDKWWDIMDSEYPCYFDEKPDNLEDEAKQTEIQQTCFAEPWKQPQQQPRLQRRILQLNVDKNSIMEPVLRPTK